MFNTIVNSNEVFYIQLSYKQPMPRPDAYLGNKARQSRLDSNSQLLQIPPQSHRVSFSSKRSRTLEQHWYAGFPYQFPVLFFPTLESSIHFRTATSPLLRYISLSSTKMKVSQVRTETLSQPLSPTFTTVFSMLPSQFINFTKSRNQCDTDICLPYKISAWSPSFISAGNPDRLRI